MAIYSSRVLDEQLPLQCEKCSFAFSRSLGEYFALGRLNCPNCGELFPLNEDEIEEIVDMLEGLHSMSDDLMEEDDEDDW